MTKNQNTSQSTNSQSAQASQAHQASRSPPVLPVPPAVGSTFWTHDVPPNNKRSVTHRLLTIGNIALTGVWSGKFGEHYVGWAVLSADEKAKTLNANH